MRNGTKWSVLLAALALLAVATRTARRLPEGESVSVVDGGAAAVDLLSTAEVLRSAQASERVAVAGVAYGDTTYALELRLHEHDGTPVAALGAKWSVRLERDANAPGEGPIAALEGPAGSVEAEPGTRLVLLDGSIGERQITFRESSVELGDQQRVALVGDLPPWGGVRVVDARTGIDLAAVQVIPCGDAEATTALPALSDLGGLRPSSPSPVSLPANPRPICFWIGAQDHAWRQIEFGEASGSPVYALEAGGGLKVQAMVPSDQSTEFVLILERRIEASPRTELLAEETLAAPSFVLGGLPVGKVAARVFAHRHNREPLLVATREVDVQPGEVSELSLDLVSQWRPDQAGEILLSVWLEDPADAAVLMLSSTRAGEPSAESSTAMRELKRGSDGRYRWLAEVRSPGRYLVSTMPDSVATEVSVEAGSRVHAALNAPALPKLRLWTLDKDTGAEVVPQLVVWRGVGRSGTEDWAIADRRTMAFPVAPGPIEIGVQAPGFATAKVDLDITPGWNEQMIELVRVAPREIHVRLTSGACEVPAPEETWSSTTVTDSSGRSVLVAAKATPSSAQDVRGAGSILVVEGPGSYQVALGRVPGFRTRGAEQVTVGDEGASVTFELEPGENAPPP